MRLCEFVKLYLILFFGSSSVRPTRSSRIKFEDGFYNDVLVAVSPSLQLNTSSCLELMQKIEDLFRSSSIVLRDLTLGESSFGTVNILLPSDSSVECGNHLDARIYETYENADFKITNEHPLASTLPWTKQPGSCEEPAESIFIPTSFFSSPLLLPSEKTNIFVHEWAKFRYRVFEEYGFYQDPLYPSCHAFNGLYYFTSNSEANLTLNDTLPYHPPILPETCKFLIEENTDLNDRINFEPASLMFSPFSPRHLSLLESGEKRQGISPTKQNIQCNRRSVGEIVSSHPDFSAFRPKQNIKKRSLARSLEPTFNILMAKQKFDGFLFIVETPGNSHNMNHVKQAIGQMVYLIPFNPETRVRLVTFNYNTAEFHMRDAIVLNSINNKKRFMASFGPVNKINKTSTSMNLPNVFEQILKQLEEEQEFVNWHFVFFSSSPPIGLSRAVDEMKKSENEISIFNFEPSKYWLQWNKIPNTQQMIYIPSCSASSFPCSTFTPSFITDHLLTLIQSTREKKHIKVMEVLITSTRNFRLDNLVNNETYTFVLPVFNTLEVNLRFSLTSGDETCELVEEYPNVFVSKPDCNINGGVVNYDYGNLRVNTHFLNVYKEKNSIGLINVRQFFNQDLSNEIYPNFKQLVAYVSLSSKDEKPILDSFVSINEIIETPARLEKVPNILRDDGISPDVTSGDGIYSTFLSNFSPSPFTFSQLEINTESSSALESILPPQPALLDPKLSTKCCGSVVHRDRSVQIPKESYFFTLPTFRFAPNSPSFIFPQIDHLRLTNQSSSVFSLQFEQSENSTISTYFELCCTSSPRGNVNKNLCTQMPPCAKEHAEPGKIITKCEMAKSDAAFDRKYDTEGNPSDPINYIYCGVRESNGNFTSDISRNFIEIQMDEVFFRVEDVTSSCDSLSDNCLPIDVFWGLIACICGIFGILLIVLFFWFLFCHRDKAEKKAEKKKSESEVEDVWLNKNKLETRGRQESLEGIEGKSLGNVFINQAYIQDANGDLKIIASNGQIIGGEEEMEDESEMSGNHRETPGNHRLGNSVPLSSIRKSESRNDNLTDMMVFKSGTKEYSLTAEPPPSSFLSRPPLNSEIFSDTPKPKERPSIKNSSNNNNSNDNDSGYQNHHNQFMVMPFNNQVKKKPSRRDSDDLSPIYASVNRNGRRNLHGQNKSKKYKTSTGFPSHEFAFLDAEAHHGGNNDNKHFKFIDGDFPLYHPSVGGSSGRGSIFTLESSPPLPPPLPNKNANLNTRYTPSSSRLDHFPSSESDSLNSEKIEDPNRNPGKNNNKNKLKGGKDKPGGFVIPKPPPMPPSPKSWMKSYNGGSSNGNTWNSSRPKLSKSSSINSNFSSVSKMSHGGNNNNNNTDRESVISELNSFFKRAPPPGKTTSNNPDVLNNASSKPELPPKRVVLLKRTGPPPVPPPRPPKGAIPLPLADEEDFEDDDSDEWEDSYEFDFSYPGVSHV